MASCDALGIGRDLLSYQRPPSRHEIRIYGEEFAHSFQLVLKEKGVRWHKFGKVYPANGKRTLDVKELAYIALRGTLSDDEKEKVLLRKLYHDLKSNT